MNYHVGVDGKQDGPFADAEIRQRIADGRLGAADLCWTAGWPEWRAVRDAFPDAFVVAAPPSLPVAPGTALPPPVPVPRSNAELFRSTGSAATTGSASSLAPLASNAPPSTDALAIIALILGIFPLFSGIPAIVCGHISRSRIKKSEGRLGGAGMALAGCILGYAWLTLIGTFILLIIVMAVVSPTQFNG